MRRAGACSASSGTRTPQGEGLDGIELTLDSLLRGTQGTVSLLKDVRGGRFESPDELSADPTPGHTVTLTINGALQSIADQALGNAVTRMNADGGDILVLDPNSGEILAMAIAPQGSARDVRDGDQRAVSARLHAQAVHGRGAARAGQGSHRRGHRDVQRFLPDVRRAPCTTCTWRRASRWPM